jgi:hypothetical protein
MRMPQIVALLGALFSPIAMAQMRAMAPLGPTPVNFPSPLRTSFAGRPFSHPGAIVLGAPFLYADYPAQPWTVQSQPPQVVIVQPASSTDTPPETKAEPLMIELQGTRYVRFGGRQQSAERGINVPPDYADPITQRASQPELPPAILIFRDGHREPVPEYAIVGGTLYASGDYWQTGHWTRNIQLSALNLPATIQANHDAGIKFTLPSAPNEVVTRP